MASLKLRFKKKIDETRNDLMNEKHKKTRNYLNYVEHLLNLASTITGCISISEFASLVCVPVGITSSAVSYLKNCTIIAGIKKYKSIIKKKKKNYDKIVLLVKRKLETTEVLISKDLIDSYVSHDKFNPVKNVLRDDNEMKKEIKNTCFSHLLLFFKGKTNNQEF